ncbi:MAG: hypothetical protein ACI93T_003217 [Porticoccaceae bacterium]|jgi:hypothetical protein
MPAQAGTQNFARRTENRWFPAFAGMTEMTTWQLQNVPLPRLHTEFAVTRIRPRLLLRPDIEPTYCLTPL